jgi:hypothetical protein
MSLDLATWAPSALALGASAVAVAVYRLRSKRIFAHDLPSEDAHLPEDQHERFSSYPEARSLQIRTNWLHDDAVRAKIRYETWGVAAAMAAPSLIWLFAAAPLLTAHRLANDTGIELARAMVVLGLLAVLWIVRNPTRNHVEIRLRAETLRFHLHAYLAGVGPYAEGTSVSAELRDSVEGWSTAELLAHLQDCEPPCHAQASGTMPFRSLPEFGAAEAHAYLVERVGEQTVPPPEEMRSSRTWPSSLKPIQRRGVIDGYFPSTARRMGRAFTSSVVLTFIAIGGAAAAAVAKLFVHGEAAGQVLLVTFLVLAGLAVLLAALRGVFGWDGKASLYQRQQALLATATRDLAAAFTELETSAAHEQSGGPVSRVAGSGAAVAFRRSAARFEALMLREAADWALISDRRFYEVTP